MSYEIMLVPYKLARDVDFSSLWEASISSADLSVIYLVLNNLLGLVFSNLFLFPLYLSCLF